MPFSQGAARSARRSPSGQRGRLIFALDATMSRQPTWDTACRLQGDMFRETAAIGGLDVQLVYFRGLGECRASRWVSDARQLGALMEKIDCRGGHTQIGKVLAHAKRENEAKKVQALVFVGDAMEEPIDDLCAAAGELGLLGVPAFVFQEGHDAVAEQAFREIARLTRGAYCRFDIRCRPRARRTVARGRGLCGRRHEGARRSQGTPQQRRGQAAGADEIAMPTTVLRHRRSGAAAVGAQRLFQGRSEVSGEGAAAGRRHPGARQRQHFCSFAARLRSRSRSGSPDWACSAGGRSLDRLVPAHAEDPGAGVAGALGVRRNGARPRHRHDARH